jgi:hypothetical protein
LLDKLAAVEKRLAELELKYGGTSLTAEALALKNEADEKEKERDLKKSDEKVGRKVYISL